MKKLFFIMSNLQTLCHFKLDLQRSTVWIFSSSVFLTNPNVLVQMTTYIFWRLQTGSMNMK